MAQVKKAVSFKNAVAENLKLLNIGSAVGSYSNRTPLTIVAFGGDTRVKIR